MLLGVLVFVSAVLPVTIERTGSSLIFFGVQARGLPIWISLPIVFALPCPALNRGHAGRREGLGQSALTLRAPRTPTGRAARPLGSVPGGGGVFRRHRHASLGPSSSRSRRGGSDGPTAQKQLRPEDVRVARIERQHGVTIAALTDRSLPPDSDLLHGPPPGSRW